MRTDLLQETLHRLLSGSERRAAGARDTFRASQHLEALEPRLLLAADLAGALGLSAVASAEASHSPDPGSLAHLPFSALHPDSGPTGFSLGSEAIEARLPSGLPQPIALDTFAGALGGGQSAESAELVVDEPAIRLELVFVDENVNDFEALVEGLFGHDNGREVEIHVLDRRRDGIDQITEVLTRHEGLAAVHILSHATEGAVALGDARLDAYALDTRADQLRDWGDALSSEADLLIYGCSLADGAQGEAMLKTLGELTGADVAASNDVTGAAPRGGDWDLEYRSGSIETQVGFATEPSHTWSGRLAIENVRDEFNAVSYAGNDGTTNFSNSWQELGESDGVSLGDVTVQPGGGFSSKHLHLETDTAGRGLSRTVDLSDTSSATLTFDSRRLGGGGTVELQVSTGGAPVTLKTFNLSGTDPSPVSNSFDLSPHLSASTEITFVVTTSGGGSFFAVDNVQIASNNNDGALWLSTRGDVTTGGQPGVEDFEEGDLVQLSDPNLAFGPGGTAGTTTVPFSAEVFSSTSDIRGAHFVTSDIQIGASSFQLKAGDLLLTTRVSETFTSSSTPGPGFTNNLVVNPNDVFVFRPDSPGNYGEGTFAMLLEGLPGTKTRGITLIEQDTVVGDTTLQAGDFLFADNSSGAKTDVQLFETTDVGAGNTNGTISVLLEGDDTGISFGSEIRGIELVEQATIVGGHNLSAGTLLITLGDPGVVGTNNFSVNPQDAFALDVTKTTLVAGTGNAEATASAFFTGADVGFDTNNERIDAFTLLGPDPNSAPSGTDATIVTDEDTDFTFAATDFGFSDPNGNSLLAVEITTLPLAGTGTLTLNSAPVIAGQSVTALDIAANKLVYTPPGDANGNGFATFTFRVQDDGGTANGGVDLDPTPNTLTIDVTALNDKPVVTTPSPPIVYTVLDPPTQLDPLATASDVDSPDFDGGTLTVSLSATATADDELSILPGGNVTLAGFDVLVSATTIGSFSGGTAGGDLVITWNANSTPSTVEEVLRQIAFHNSSGAPDTSTRIIDFVLTDGDGGVADTSQQQVNFTGGNAPPLLTAPSLAASFVENGPPVLIDAAATVSDIDSPDLAGGILTVALSTATANDNLSVVAGGNVTLNGFDVEVSGTAIGTFSGGTAGGDLSITWDADSTPGTIEEVLRRIAYSNTSEDPDTSTRTVELTLTDGDGGTSLTIQQQVNVLAVNDAPQGADKIVATDEDTDFTFAIADFGFTDPVESDSLLAVKITTLPLAGTGILTLNSAPVITGQTVSAANIAANKLVYSPPGDANGNGLATFTFQVQDDGDTANGGVDLDQSANTITIDVTALNDEPAGTDTTVVTDEDTDFSFATTDFGFTDPVESDSLLAVKITTLPLPGTGTLTLNSVAVTTGQTVSAVDIAANRLAYTPPSNTTGTGIASFTFQVQDDGGTANGGVDSDPSANTITIDVVLVAIPPEPPPILPPPLGDPDPSEEDPGPDEEPSEPRELPEASEAPPEAPESALPPANTGAGAVAPANPPALPVATTVAPDNEVVTTDPSNDLISPTSRGDSDREQNLVEQIAEQVIELPGEIAEIAEAIIERVEDGFSSIEEAGFLNALDRVREEASESAVITQTVVGASTATTTVLSVGYIAWLARGGLLLSSFLSSMPAWRLIDPVPVLAYLNDEEREEDDESLTSLVTKQSTEPGVDPDDQSKGRSATVDRSEVQFTGSPS